MYEYIGKGYIPGVPARDLTDEEYKAAVDAGRIKPDSQAAKAYRKKGSPSTRRGAAADEEVTP